MLEKVLVTLDGSKLAESVIPVVLKLAQAGGVREVLLLRVCEPLSVLADYPSSEPTWQKHIEQLTARAADQCALYLGDAVQRLKSQGVNVKSVTALGKAADEIVSFAEKNKVDLIAIASHGRSGPSRWAFGSVADKVLRSTTIPVLLVHASATPAD